MNHTVMPSTISTLSLVFMFLSTRVVGWGARQQCKHEWILASLNRLHREGRRRVWLSCSPLPCTRGRGDGGEGVGSARRNRNRRPGTLSPHPRPLAPEYRGEGRNCTTCVGSVHALVRQLEPLPELL